MRLVSTSGHKYSNLYMVSNHLPQTCLVRLTLPTLIYTLFSRTSCVVKRKVAGLNPVASKYCIQLLNWTALDNFAQQTFSGFLVFLVVGDDLDAVNWTLESG